MKIGLEVFLITEPILEMSTDSWNGYCILHTQTYKLIQMEIEFQPHRTLYAQMRTFKISLKPCEKKTMKLEKETQNDNEQWAEMIEKRSNGIIAPILLILNIVQNNEWYMSAVNIDIEQQHHHQQQSAILFECIPWVGIK